MLRSLLFGLIFSGAAATAEPVFVSFTLTLPAVGPERFTDGYPTEVTSYSAPRRLLSIRERAEAQVHAGNVVRLRLARPLTVRTEGLHAASTLVFPFVDVRLTLADLAALVKVGRAEAGEVVLTSDRAGRPVALELAAAELAFGLIDFAWLKTGGAIEVGRVRLKFAGHVFGADEFNRLPRGLRGDVLVRRHLDRAPASNVVSLAARRACLLSLVED